MPGLPMGMLELPAELAEFSAVTSTFHDYEKERAGLGYSVAYVGPRDELTTYVYTLGIADLPNGIDSPAFRSHLQQCVDEIARSAPCPDLKVASQGSVGVPGRTTEIGYVVLEGTPNGEARPVHNIVWLSVAKNHFVKVRCTTRAMEALTENLVQRVSRALVHHFEPPPATSRGPATFDTPVQQSIRRHVSEASGMAAADIHPDMSIRDELRVSDIELITLTMALEEEFGIELHDTTMDSVVTVRDLIRLVEQTKPELVRPEARQAQAPPAGPIPARATPPAQQPSSPEPGAHPEPKAGFFSRLFGRK